MVPTHTTPSYRRRRVVIVFPWQVAIERLVPNNKICDCSDTAHVRSHCIVPIPACAGMTRVKKDKFPSGQRGARRAGCRHCSLHSALYKRNGALPRLFIPQFSDLGAWRVNFSVIVPGWRGMPPGSRFENCSRGQRIRHGR